MASRKAANTVRYGLWKEGTARHGECWRFQIRVLESDGKMHRRAGSGFRTKDECEAAVAKLRLDTRERKFGLERPVPLKPTTIGEAVEDYLKVLTARWEAKHGQEYAERNSGQVNALRYWAEFAGLSRRVDSLTKDDLVYWMQHESKRAASVLHRAPHQYDQSRFESCERNKSRPR